jgi:hypothetical protein
MSAFFDVNEILTCLKNTYSSPDKKIREESEKKLSELKNQNIVEFTSQLITLLKSNAPEIDKNIKLSRILLLKRSLKEKIQNAEISQTQNEQLIQQFIIILVYPSLSKKELENLIEVFSMSIELCPGETLIGIINYIKKEIASMPLGSFNGVISILTSIITSKSLTNKFFSQVLSTSLEMGSSMIENLFPEYEKINMETNLDDYLKLNEMFGNSFEFLFQSNFKSYKRFNLKEAKIDNLFFKMFILGMKLLVNVKSNNDNKIISWTNEEKIDKNINTMKIKIFRFLNLQTNCFGDVITDQNKISVTNQLTKIIINDISWIILNKYSNLMKLEIEDEQGYYSDYNYSLLISYMFIYLKRILYKDNFTKEYTTLFNGMYKNILLPLLILTNLEEEIALDNDSVNGYCIGIDDIISENKEKRIKSTVAGLIKVFYKKNNESNNFIIKYTLGLLEFLISGNNNNLFNNKDIFNENDIIIVLFKAYSKEKIATAIFLVLNILSEVDSKNDYLNDHYIRDYFDRIFDSLSKINNPLLKHQVILFISNYSLRFYEPDSDAFETKILYLYDCLFETEYSLISNSASQAIQNFFDKKNKQDPNIKTTLLKAAIKNISKFENHIANIQVSNFFDVLYQILLNFDKLDNEFFIQIFEKICKRINVEEERHRRLKFKVKKVKNKAKKKAKEQTNLNDYNIIINKCFNIIRMLVHSKTFVISNMQKIEEALSPLVAYMDNPNKIDFDEDIISITYYLIIHNEKLTQIPMNLIEHLYKYCQKIEGLLLDMYELINAYLAYGTDIILSYDNLTNGIYLAFEQGIKNIKYKNSPLYTCLLIQTWIINCPKIPEKIVENLINLIINEIREVIKDYKETKSTGENNYNFLGFVTVILSGLINYSNIIIPILTKNNYGDSLKDWLQIINKEDEAGYEYEIKIIVYSICFVIQKGIIKGDINDLLNITVLLLKTQEYNGKYEIRKKNKKDFKVNFTDDSEESDNDDEDENELSEYNEIKDLIKKTINPIKNMDEFKMFRELLLFLKNNQSEIYLNWEKTLDENKKNLVNNLFGTKRINISGDNYNNVQVPRRIVSIKRNLNQNNQ